MYIGLHVKYPIFLYDFNKVFSTDFRMKPSNIKFRENPSSGSRVVPCGRTDGWTWRKKNCRFSQVCEKRL